MSGSSSDMASTPKGMRLHIGVFGRRNAGKSSLVNALAGHQVSIVSDTAGTTTDPVEKAMELPPLGPVLLIDTAGLDDEGELGAMRVEKTRKAIDRTDLALVVSDGARWSDFEEDLVEEFLRRKVPVAAVFGKSDQGGVDRNRMASLLARGICAVQVSARDGSGMGELRQALIQLAPESAFADRPIVSDIVGRGKVVILVTPIDKEAPRGRLILPQVQTIRDLLDGHAITLVVTTDQLSAALECLKEPPCLVVTDSQAFREVADILPAGVPLTSFSILFARLKGDLATQAEGALAVSSLKPGDRVLVAEACTHHPVEEDIGRVKIPRMLVQKAGGDLEFHMAQGRDFPEDLSPYALVVHCGACTFNRRGMLGRIESCRQQGVPVSNYGLVIAAAKGILERSLEPFPEVLERLRQGRGRMKPGK